MKRNTLREYLMNCFYQMDIKEDFSMGSVQSYIDGLKDSENIEDLGYLTSNIKSFLDNKGEVDELITKSLKNWKFDRVAKIDMAILRVSVTEMLYDETVPYKVSINEAVNLSKKFSEDASSKFVNGVLANVVKLRSLDEAKS